MSAPSSPDPREELREQLIRERYGDLTALTAELTGHVPAPPRTEPRRPAVNVTPALSTPVRPAGTGRYADDHKATLRWLKRSHPSWRQELCVLGAGGVAHVVTSSGPTIGYSLCGKRGEALPASTETPVCRVCTA